MVVPGTKKGLYGMPFKIFQQGANEFMAERNFPKIKWSNDKYEAVFQD
jgi:hypothetical protein